MRRLNTTAVLADAATLPPVPLEPPGQGTQSEAIHTRQPVILIICANGCEKVELQNGCWVRTMAVSPNPGLYVPMLAQGRVIGVIQVQSYTLNRFKPIRCGVACPWSPIQLQRISRMPACSADTQKRVHNLAALHEIDVAISASVDIHVTLDILLEQTVSELNADAAAVLLLNPLARSLEYAASQGFRNHQVKGLHIPVGAGLAGQAALHRQMQSVPACRMNSL